MTYARITRAACAAAAALAFGVSGLASSPAAAQNLINNGNFEATPTQGDPVPQWEESGAVGTYVNNNGEYCCGLGGGVPEGQRAAAFGGGGGDVGSLRQTFSTTAGTPYDVSFLLARVGGPQDQGLTAQVFDGTNGQPITGLLTFDDEAGGTFEQEGFSFTATSSISRLVLTSTPSGCCTDLLVDAVSVTAVPEPAALGVLSAAGLLLVRRRRRS